MARHKVAISPGNKGAVGRLPLTVLLRMVANRVARLKAAISPVNKAARPKLAVNPPIKMEAALVRKAAVIPIPVAR